MIGEFFEYLQSHFIGRIVFFALCILTLVLALLFKFQNSMLYIPGSLYLTSDASIRKNYGGQSQEFQVSF